MRSVIAVLPVLLAALVAGCTAPVAIEGIDVPGVPTPPPVDGTVSAHVETRPVPNDGDAADDAAIWVHPSDPASSTVIGTDKDGGIGVYDLDGRELHYEEAVAPNNVDLRADFPLGGGRVALVAVSEKSEEQILLYRVDPGTRGLRRIGAVDSGIDLYGVCLHRSARTGTFSVFGTAYDGELRQWELTAAGPQVRGALVRTVDVGGQIEGCAADDELGRLYVGEEEEALWRYGAEPGDGDARTKVDGVGRLAPDIEGVAVAAGTGHVVVSSQGSDDYAIYARAGSNAYLGRFAVGDAGPIDGTSHTDGLDVATVALGPRFPHGVLVVQDDDNDGSDADRQNFKFVRWDAVLGSTGLSGRAG